MSRFPKNTAVKKVFETEWFTIDAVPYRSASKNHITGSEVMTVYVSWL